MIMKAMDVTLPEVVLHKYRKDSIQGARLGISLVARSASKYGEYVFKTLCCDLDSHFL